MSRSVLALALFGATLSAQAATPVGKWIGTIEPKLDMSKFTPDQKKQANAMLDKIRSTKIALIMKADKSFTIGPASNPERTQKGTWSQKGNTVTLGSSNPQNPQQKQDQKATLSADGKLMTLTSVNPMGTAIITFRKA